MTKAANMMQKIALTENQKKENKRINNPLIGNLIAGPVGAAMGSESGKKTSNALSSFGGGIVGAGLAAAALYPRTRKAQKELVNAGKILKTIKEVRKLLPEAQEISAQLNYNDKLIDKLQKETHFAMGATAGAVAGSTAGIILNNKRKK